ncbi:hypothetical protein RTBOTA2_005403 [Rhodotorula toruloides]|uniref:Uncharacterized protein n=1 Tax=Rhodotorula toruloides TaxID=5286 RepID=A0A2T0A1G3_RHOTO|nr:hypothetical protein RTBOTA2_005403 [Rhodotorula toruloides]PRQ71840.1 hypothetical protein AAT19DRAFT_9955 [Rhodotorula toruloides]
MSFFAEDSDEALAHQRMKIAERRTDVAASTEEEHVSNAAAWRAQEAYDEHSNNSGRPQDVEDARSLATVLVAQAVDQMAKDVNLEHVNLDKANDDGAAQMREVITEDNY